uniref:Uncharacterized protein n=1 Tax=Arundo donax TaxID=35708 RepID=A0A0A8YT65_ARUDO
MYTRKIFGQELKPKGCVAAGKLLGVNICPALQKGRNPSGDELFTQVAHAVHLRYLLEETHHRNPTLPQINLQGADEIDLFA